MQDASEAAATTPAATPAISPAVSRFARRRARVERVAKRINSNRTLRVAARIGLGANGLVHFLIGTLAVGVAFGYGGSASQSGALAAIAASPGGHPVLWVASGALWALALWQLTDAAWVNAPVRRLRVTRRLGDVGRSISFAAVGAATAVVAAGVPDEGEVVTSTAGEQLLGTTEGIVTLIIAGLTVGTFGGISIFRGVSRNFRQENAELHGAIGRIVDVLGIFGFVTKGFALLVIGALAIYAAIFTDPDQVGGLDGALKYLASLPSGTVLLTGVGVGFIAYGFYLLARAIYLRTELAPAPSR